MRKIFLDDLPRTYKGVDWKNSVGNKVKFIYDDIEGEIEIIDYMKGKKSMIKIRYKEYYDIIFVGHFSSCNIGKILKKNTNEFKFEINENIKDTKRDLILTNREYRSRIKKDGNVEKQKWYKYMCNNCGWNEGWIEESKLNSQKGCSCCYGRTAVLGINTIWDTDRWMCDLGVSEEYAKKYTPKSNKSIQVTCPNCATTKKICISNIYVKKSIGCTCGDGQSYISKYIKSMLDQLNIQYESEIRYEWNKYINPKNNKESQARIDFVIYKDGREIPLEADGEFHRKDNSMSGQTEEESKFIDNEKDKNCLKYLGEETIRISNEGDIRENILNSKLNELFDLSTIDWVKCENFALKNIVKEVCDYWNTKEEWETTSSIAKVFNLDKTTIIKYLKKGTALDYCHYKSEDEINDNILKFIESKSKKVNVFKDDKSIGIFSSARELERVSEGLFGIRLCRSSISASCKGIGKTYKGFTFKYI